MSIATDPETMQQNGIVLQRTFTTPDRDPFDTVVWKRSLVELRNDTGEVIFSQEVEAPSFWSPTAIKIAASKYFCLQEDGTRENSVRDMIERVVRTIVTMGREQGYFGTADNTALSGPTTETEQIFSDELTYILLHQYAAFNSPVWFNFGAKGHAAQASACQPGWSLINTPEGAVPIQQLVENNAIGKLVLSANGITKISAVKNNGEKPVLRITTKSGHILDVTEDHLVWSANGHKFVKACTLRPGDRVQWVRHEQMPCTVTSINDQAIAALVGWLQTDGYVGQPASATSKVVPAYLQTAPLDVVATYLKSIFQADGYVSIRERSAHIGLQSISPEFISAIQTLLWRFGIFSRIRPKPDGRKNRADGWLLIIGNKIDRQLFQKFIEFTSRYKSDKLAESLLLDGHAALDDKDLTIATIEAIGTHTVYDIQTDCNEYLSNGLRVHNCFILDVEDTMESILQAAADEAMLFKYGSGAGMNLSKLRSSKESLSCGGKPSGPVSFLHGYDAWAGTVKSGGVSRRAALMMELDMDHGDIQDFITSKATEEYKAHLLHETAGLVQMLDGIDTDVLERILAQSAAAGETDLPTLGLLEELQQRRLIAPYLAEFSKAHTWDGFTNNEAYGTVGLQNMNVSISAPDAFMRKVAGLDADPHWYLLGRQVVRWEDTELAGLPERDVVRFNTAQGILSCKLGETVPAYILTETNELHRVLSIEDANKLMDMIAEAAWKCGDPGIQFIDTINQWWTGKNSAKIRGSNPCGEVYLPDNNSCNLASIRVSEFLRDDNTFNNVAFVAVAQLIFCAQDMMIAMASYPTDSIAEQTKKYRAIGMGVTDLGALLMMLGLPYDSDAGRDYAAVILSLLTATGYTTSLELARVLAPCEAYAANAQSMLQVLRKHTDYSRALSLRASATSSTSTVDKEIRRLSYIGHDLWLDLVNDGPFRNMAATCAAPAGTTGFLLGCYTTGIEPSVALISYKQLVGGGMLKQVNGCVARALKSLGYTQPWIQATLQCIEEHGHVGSDVAAEHYAVFDCALAVPGSDRVISPMGHLKMLEALQPFISMGISKTVNLPMTITPEELKQLYIAAWQMGLKGIALYRDGSKRTQPLSTALSGPQTVGIDLEAWKRRAHELGLDVPMTDAESHTGCGRERLPDSCPSLRHKFTVGGHEGYLHCGMYTDGRLGEIFVRISKEGSTISGVIDAFATLFSIALQRGTPLEDLVTKFAFTRFEPSGWTPNRNIPKAESVIDYIVRWLAFQFLPRATAKAIGVHFFDDATEAQEQGIVYGVAQPSVTEDGTTKTNTNPQESQSNAIAPPQTLVQAPIPAPKLLMSDAPPCPTCGTTMRRNGSCMLCPNCGSTSGCS